MNLPTDVLVAAVEALRKAETLNDSIQGFLYGNRCVLRDVSKKPGADELWSQAFDPDEYQVAHDAMLLEQEAIKDARRIMAVSKVLALYERNRVWTEALTAVEATYIPEKGSAPQSSLDLMEQVSREECVITGAIRCKDEAVTTVKRAMHRDKAHHGDFANDVPLGGQG